MTDVITAHCPECSCRFRLKPDMIGKRMRCTDCETVFEVEPVEPAVASRSLEPASFDWQNAPPPVQGETPIAARAEPTARPPIPNFLPVEPPPPKGRRWLVAALALAVVGTVVGGGIALSNTLGRAENKQVEAAQKAFDEGLFAQAARGFDGLATDHPRSPRASEYRFLADLAGLRDVAIQANPQTGPAYDALARFLNEHDKSPYFARHREEFVRSALRIADDLLAEGDAAVRATPGNLPDAELKAGYAKIALTAAEQHAKAGADLGGPRGKLQQFNDAVRLTKARTAARAQVLAILAQPKPDLETARELIRRAGFADDPEVSGAWRKALDGVRATIVHRPLDRAAAATMPARPAGVVPEPLGAAQPGPRIPALAQGVLYALDAKGRIAWVDRLGVDATIPPLRLPGEGGETWLVISAEPRGLSARSADDGAVRWFQPLDDIPVGPPVVLNGRAYVALGAAVVEIDARTGKLAGSFDFQQPLAGGLAVRPGTTQLYVPAAGQQIFVLDVAPEDGPPRCVATLATDHPTGSLRTAPAVIGAGDQAALVLQLAEGLDCGLHLHRLDAPTGSPTLTARVRLPGWPWFPPHADAERLAAATDRGVLGLFGFRRPGAADPPLYPLDDRPASGDDGATPQRALIVHADGAGLVALTGGKLARWELGIDRVKGRVLAPVWAIAEPLGSPIQPAEAVAPGVVALTTLRADPPATLATAVRVATGEIVWQRTLGLSPGVAFATLGAGIIAVEPHGAVLAFDTLTPLAHGWQSGGRPLAGPTNSRPVLVATATDVWTFAASDKGTVIRRIGAERTVDERKLDLPAPLAGTPAAGPDLILPLANGSLVRLGRATADRALQLGPTWRAATAEPDAVGHVVAWFEHSYLATDGDRRLLRLTWNGPDFDLASPDAMVRPKKIVGLPLALPEKRAALADASGTVVLVRGERFEVERTWKLGKQIVAGPMLLGGKLAVSLDDGELVMLDPAADKPLWRFPAAGVPALIDGRIVVGDAAGRLWRLDLATGKPDVEGGIALPTAAAGPALPLAGGVVVPLADGTLHAEAAK